MANEKDETTKTCLVHSALKLFARFGFDGVSVKEICQKARVNISLVSYHFGGKEGLYKACLEPFADSELEFFEKTFKPPKTIEELKFQIRFLLEHIIDHWSKHPEVTAIIHRGFDGDDKVVFDLFKKSFYRIFQLVHDLFTAGQEAGFIRSDVDVRVAGALLLGGITQEIRLEGVRKKLSGLSLHDPQFRELVISNTVEIFISGMKKERP